MKQKTPKVKRKAPTAKRFRSLAVLSRSSGVRLMLSHTPMLPPRPMLCPKPSPPPATLIQFSASWENEAHLELDRKLKRHGIMSVLFETPSGFAIFIMREGDLKKPDAMQNIWRNFISERRVKKFILPCEFREFKDKSSAIHDTGMNWELAELITAWSRPGQKMAVGKPEYKGIIERVLGVPCLFNEVVMEVMWALQNLMHFLVPEEKMELRNEDRVPMSQGLKMHLNRYGFDVKPEMVNENVLMAACILFDYECLDAKNATALRFAGEIITDLSGIDTEVWDLMELATAVKIICCPAERTVSDEAMFTRDVVKTLVRDAHKYEGKIDKEIYLKAYHQIVYCRKHGVKIREILGSYLPACDGHQS